MKRLVLLVCLLACLAFASTASAAQTEYAYFVGDFPLVSYGGQVTFTVTSTAAPDRIDVFVDCDQAGTLVYSDSSYFDSSYRSKAFTMGQGTTVNNWPFGAADCQAVLFVTQRNKKAIDSGILYFHVDP